MLSGSRDCACGHSYVFLFLFWPEESGPQNVDALFYRADWVTHVTLSSTDHKDPQKHHQVVLNASMQQGVGVTSDIFPLLALLIMCFDVFPPRRTLERTAPRICGCPQEFYIYVDSVLLLFFFTLEAPFFVLKCFCFIVFDGGWRGGAFKAAESALVKGYTPFSIHSSPRPPGCNVKLTAISSAYQLRMPFTLSGSKFTRTEKQPRWASPSCPTLTNILENSSSHRSKIKVSFFFERMGQVWEMSSG